jgi:hypothetical protein
MNNKPRGERGRLRVLATNVWSASTPCLDAVLPRSPSARPRARPAPVNWTMDSVRCASLDTRTMLAGAWHHGWICSSATPGAGPSRTMVGGSDRGRRRCPLLRFSDFQHQPSIPRKHTPKMRTLICLVALLPALVSCKPEVTSSDAFLILERGTESSVEALASGQVMEKRTLMPGERKRFVRVAFQMEVPEGKAWDTSKIALVDRARSEPNSGPPVAFRLIRTTAANYDIDDNGPPGNVWRTASAGMMVVARDRSFTPLSNGAAPHHFENHGARNSKVRQHV